MRQFPGTPFPIAQVDRSGPPGGITCPMFLCQVCSFPVYSVPTEEYPLSGYVLWWNSRYRDGIDGEPKYDQIGPMVVHRPRCADAAEAAVGEYLRGNPAWYPAAYSADLASWLQHLVNNTTSPIGTDEDPEKYLYRAPGALGWRIGFYGR